MSQDWGIVSVAPSDQAIVLRLRLSDCERRSTARLLAASLLPLRCWMLVC
jgi:hypothetical protein